MTMGSRAVRGWAQLVLQVGLVLMAAGLVQVVAERTNRRVDLTVARELSLSEVTRRVLDDVEESMSITVFYARGQRSRYAGLLSRIRAAAPQVTTELYDLDRYPERARAMGVSRYGRAVIEYRDRRTVTLAEPEREILGGLLTVLRERAVRLGFTAGHGERTPAVEPTGYARLAAALETEGYRIELVPIGAGPVAQEIDLLVIAGPQLDFAPETAERVRQVLERGNGVLALLDPHPLPNLSSMLATLGVVVGDDIVVDHERRVLSSDGLTAVVEFFRRGNPISEPTSNPIESGVVLPSARTIDVQPEPGAAGVESIARTGPTAWAMADPDRARRGAEPTVAAGDRRGPLSLMVMGEIGSGRLVVIGDADFASDAYFDLLGNGRLALNAVAWTAREDRLTGERNLDVPEVQRPLSPLVVTVDVARRLFVAIVIVQPALVLVLGLIVVGVWRRRG